MKNSFPAHPTDLFDEWFHLAKEKEHSYPSAMSLATVNSKGRPNVRIVLMRHFGKDGLYFYTNYESDKGQALISTPFAEGNFYWKSIERQIRVHGRVEKASAEESDSYFNGRPRESRIGAWASKQSRPMESYEDFETSIKKYTEKFEGVENPPRPDNWGGFKIIPERVEFWEERPYRLHKRFIYVKDESGSWTTRWLYP